MLFTRASENDLRPKILNPDDVVVEVVEESKFETSEHLFNESDCEVVMDTDRDMLDTHSGGLKSNDLTRKSLVGASRYDNPFEVENFSLAKSFNARGRNFLDAVRSSLIKAK